MGLLGVFLMAVEDPAKADFDEDEGACRCRGTGRPALLVRRQCRGQVLLLPPLGCQGLLAGGPMPGYTGGPLRLLHRESLLPLVGGESSYLWTRRLCDSVVGAVWWAENG